MSLRVAQIHKINLIKKATIISYGVAPPHSPSTTPLNLTLFEYNV